MKYLALVATAFLVGTVVVPGAFSADDGDDTAAAADGAEAVVDAGVGAADAGTDAGSVEKEAESIRIDGLSPAEYEALKASGEKHEFQAEVSRMMKLIINSLYTNKEIFLRELISNASDALDKVRFKSVQNKDYLGDVPDLQIKIHVDKENKVVHITDTGIGMTKEHLVKHLGTIAKSGTSDFLSAMSGGGDTSSLIGQFGVGFYSAFLVADTVVVTSKHNDDEQHIWESDATSYSIMRDERPDEQLGRGTRISLYLKEEAQDFLETETIRGLIKKYSEFINFDIFLYTSSVVQVPAEEAEDDEEEADSADDAADQDDAAAEDDLDDEEADVEDEGDSEPEMVDKTVWDWEIINANKPIWTRSPKEVEDDEYASFFKAFTHVDDDKPGPLAHMHFTAEGEVTFRSILFVPPEAPTGMFQNYGAKRNSIKMYVRRVFITDDFEDLMPKYLSFITGVVDSDDLPLNVSRETLQQHKLLKVIKKKLVRKALEMIKKMTPEEYAKFFAQYGTAIKLGLIEDYSNRTRLSKLLRFASSNHAEDLTSLEDYVERMKSKQESIYFAAGQSRDEVEKSPFVERLLKRGYEVLYLVEPIDEYCIQNLPEFDGKKFQNVAKDGLKFGDESSAEKEAKEALATEFEPLTKYVGDKLSDELEKVVVSDRLTESPCALVANQYGWSGNMERIMKAQAYSKQDDSSSKFYAEQKKILEVNPRHPIVRELLSKIKSFEAATTEGEDAEDDNAGEEISEEEQTVLDMTRVLVDTARIRSGFQLADQVAFSQRLERMLRLSLGVGLDAEVEPEPEYPADPEPEEEEPEEEEEEDEGDADPEEEDNVHVEL